jgi:predicted CxxxxCH...CXXCH cytochrome family protein
MNGARAKVDRRRARRIALVLLLPAGCSVARPVDDDRRCSTEAACTTIHPAGILDAQSPDFHGALVRSLGYAFATCQKCHGADFAGGTSGKSCLTCHQGGPTSCTTCHGQPPDTGAHLAHQRFDCGECHVKPTTYADVGHLFTDDGSRIPAAQITFGTLARTSGAEPYWDGTRCSNVYCHGGGATLAADAAAGNHAPRWNVASDGACGACHGLPPSDHQNPRCPDCHARVVDEKGQLRVGTLHVDGLISLGDDSGTCAACHPTLSGAHQSHLYAAHRLRPPLACGDCHAVPATVTSPGHIDHDRAQVFPADTSALARSGGATPSWDPVSGQCANVYCHGGGAALGADTSASIARTPTWTGAAGAACGACHGIPPADAAHTMTMTLADCHQCHAATIDQSGALIVGATSAHMNGLVDGP